MTHLTPEATASPTEVVLTPLASRATIAMYFLMGVSLSMLGPLLSTFAKSFHVSLGTVGLLLSAFAAGSCGGTVVAWRWLYLAPGRRVLRGNLVALSIGAVGVALSQTWWELLLSGFVLGLGFGALNLSLNTLLTRTAVAGRGYRLSVGNAVFGAGAITGPLLVEVLTTRHYPVAYLALVPCAALMVASVSGLHAPALRNGVPEQRATDGRSHRRPILITFILIFNAYILLESTASGWLATDIHRGGHSVAFAASVTAGFWGGLGVGRWVGGLLHRRIASSTILTAGIAMAIVCAPFALSRNLAPFVFPLFGFVISSTFPMGLMWYSELVPHDSHGISIIILGMVGGNVVGPWMVGQLVAHNGIRAIPLALCAEAVLALSVVLYARRFQPAPSPASAP